MKSVYDEVLRRSYTLSDSDIDDFDRVFSRIGKMLSMKHVLNVKEEHKELLGKYGRSQLIMANEVMRQKLGIEREDAVHYNPDVRRLTIFKEGVRFVLQEVDNYNMKEMEKVIMNFSKEKADLVLLSL